MTGHTFTPAETAAVRRAQADTRTQPRTADDLDLAIIRRIGTVPAILLAHDSEHARRRASLAVQHGYATPEQVGKALGGWWQLRGDGAE